MLKNQYPGSFVPLAIYCSWYKRKVEEDKLTQLWEKSFIFHLDFFCIKNTASISRKPPLSLPNNVQKWRNFCEKHCSRSKLVMIVHRVGGKKGHHGNKTSALSLRISKMRNNMRKHHKNCECCHCHSWLSGNKDCHELRFSIVRIVISISIVTSLQYCLVSQGR